MGTCSQEGKPCSEYPQNIHSECKPDIKWISTSHPLNFWRARNWILELSLLCAVHHCFTSPRWSSDSFGRIEFWSKHWNLGAGDTRLPVNCIGSVSEVSQDYPRQPRAAPIMCTSVWLLASRAQNSIVCSNSIMCTKQFVICTQHTLYHVHFLSGWILFYIETLYFSHCRSVVRVSAGAQPDVP